ncbi:hypothetical protein OIU84_021180 [Salix udensis]|uniref:Uncharacterized protein n=1 Tax=Salix udensis TaxID=889485 RepID=A0AAD6KU20_9ROSI|nr:hypothetical protein OIU84_021180 [Salix udensis]
MGPSYGNPVEVFTREQETQSGGSHGRAQGPETAVIVNWSPCGGGGRSMDHSIWPINTLKGPFLHCHLPLSRQKEASPGARNEGKVPQLSH